MTSGTKKRPRDPEVVRRYKEMWIAGCGTKEIAKELDIPLNTVCGMRASYGLDPRGPTIAGGGRKAPKYDFDTIAADRSRGTTWEGIAGRFNVAPKTLRTWFSVQAQDRRRAAGIPDPVRPTVDFAAVHRDRMSGLSWDKIAERAHLNRDLLAVRYTTWCAETGTEPAASLRFASRRPEPVAAPAAPSKAEPAVAPAKVEPFVWRTVLIERPEPVAVARSEPTPLAPGASSSGGVEYTAAMSPRVCQKPVRHEGLRWWFCGKPQAFGSSWCVGCKRSLFSKQAA